MFKTHCRWVITLSMDPSAELIEVVIMLLSWYRLFRRRSPAKDEDDIKELTNLSRGYLVSNMFCFLPIQMILILSHFVFGDFGDIDTLICAQLCSLMKTETVLISCKMKRIIAWRGDLINMSGEAPENGHKFWIKEPGGCTNQGPAAALTMMNHMLLKEASALLCEAVHGNI
jgi:hypothetical protein